MKTENIIALAKSVKPALADEARADLSPGEHRVDFSVRVRGILTVSENTEKTPTVSVPLKGVLALFLSRSGATRKATEKLLVDCLGEVLAMDKSAIGEIEKASGLDALWSEKVSEILASLPKTKVSGMVRTDLTVREIDTTGLPI